jgi:hypothetical protein
MYFPVKSSGFRKIVIDAHLKLDICDEMFYIYEIYDINRADNEDHYYWNNYDHDTPPSTGRGILAGLFFTFLPNPLPIKYFTAGFFITFRYFLYN